MLTRTLTRLVLASAAAALVAAGATARPRGTGAAPVKLLSNVRDLDWSNDGTKIAYSRSGDLYVSDANGGHAHRIFDGTPYSTTASSM